MPKKKSCKSNAVKKQSCSPCSNVTCNGSESSEMTLNESAKSDNWQKLLSLQATWPSDRHLLCVCSRVIVWPMCGFHPQKLPLLHLPSTCITLPLGFGYLPLFSPFSCTSLSFFSPFCSAMHNSLSYLCSSRRTPCWTFTVTSKDRAQILEQPQSQVPSRCFLISVCHAGSVTFSHYLCSFSAPSFKHVTLCRSTEWESPPPPPPALSPPSQVRAALHNNTSVRVCVWECVCVALKCLKKS